MFLFPPRSVLFLRSSWPSHMLCLLQVNTQSPRHGGESVAEVLKAHGVRHIFTLVGGHISPILVACEKLGIRVVDTRHEATAVFAADAMARLSGTLLCPLLMLGSGQEHGMTPFS